MKALNLTHAKYSCCENSGKNIVIFPLKYARLKVIIKANHRSLTRNHVRFVGMDPTKALSQAKKAIDHVRSTLNDTWNFHGLYSGAGYGLDGLPWCTSHYTFHMVMWHIPFALSGQYFSAPNATLTFEPRIRCPYKLPFYTPFAVGTLRGVVVQGKHGEKKMFELLSTSGELFLRKLEVSGVRYPQSTITIKEGRTVTWFSKER